MNFLPILVAMYGMGTPKEDDFEVTGRSGLRMAAASRDYELRSNVVLDDPAYMYGELSKEDFGDIALSVKRTEEAPYFAHSEATEGLSFPDLPGYFDTSGNLKYFVPQGPDKVKPRFLLHSNKAKEPGKLLFETGLDWVGFSDMASMIDPGQKLYIIVHGFLSSAKTEWMQDMKNEILDKENASVVLVDWSKGCGSVLGYSTAAANTRTVARTLALLVKTLADAGAVALEHVHYIGHSLGAQTGGFFGKDVKQLTGGLVGRITGLDPAGPLFEAYGIHLTADDADFVDVLHTSVGSGWTDVVQGRLGMRKSCGHVDFYPNGGKQQPGCWKFSSCSHSKATEFYADSVRYCNFPTRSCKSYDDFLAGTCASSCADGRTCGHMGHPASMPLTGNHFTKTSKQQCAFKPVRINLRTQTVSRTLDPDAMLINSLGRSAKILLEEAEPEERRELLDALREEMAVRTGQRSAYAD
ncbi:pancreatic lipase-related protein 2-like isoform X1 [Rhipicephalus sanguineus]|uniref:pancreatic lipase-related protein 2-like isoform X1 n=1 Tax=Rhipicephalus sanguineus TaxID=34632 RepID=UPI0018945625|nr:pancreatic lipase-related protein 2-like isoform X1 [Rhipicephalus sanguineus]